MTALYAYLLLLLSSCMTPPQASDRTGRRGFYWLISPLGGTIWLRHHPEHHPFQWSLAVGRYFYLRRGGYVAPGGAVEYVHLDKVIAGSKERARIQLLRTLAIVRVGIARRWIDAYGVLRAGATPFLGTDSLYVENFGKEPPRFGFSWGAGAGLLVRPSKISGIGAEIIVGDDCPMRLLYASPRLLFQIVF